MARPSLKDPYRARAKGEGFPARSVYKLKEIQAKYRLIKSGQKVVDLGCHPGSWLKYCSTLVGPEGRVLGLDLKPPTISLAPNTIFIQADLLHLDESPLVPWVGNTDLVLSDLAPHTSGIKWLDQQRSLELNLRALELSLRLLKKKGAAVFKIFEGPETKHFTAALMSRFNEVAIHKPRSSRSTSPEMYLIAKGFKGTTGASPTQ